MKSTIYKLTLGKPNFILVFYYNKIKEVVSHHLEYTGKNALYSDSAVGQWKIKYKQ